MQSKNTKLHKITPITCFDGRKHHWAAKAHRYDDGYGATEVRWCTKCGCVTEFIRMRNTRMWRRCVDDNGEIYVEVPKYWVGKLGLTKAKRCRPKESHIEEVDCETSSMQEQT